LAASSRTATACFDLLGRAGHSFVSGPWLPIGPQVRAELRRAGRGTCSRFLTLLVFQVGCDEKIPRNHHGPKTTNFIQKCKDPSILLRFNVYRLSNLARLIFD
jgi:hypothetical protein